MLYNKMNSILEQSSLDEMDSLFESIIEDLENIDIEVPLRNGVTESMLYRHNIMKGSIMYPLFEQEDFDTSNAQDVNYEEVEDDDNPNKNRYGTNLNFDATKKTSFIKKTINAFKRIIGKFIQWLKNVVMFFSEKIINNDKFLKQHQLELEETIEKTPTVEGKMPSINLETIKEGEETYLTDGGIIEREDFSNKIINELIKNGKTMTTFEFVCKKLSLGKGTDLYSVLESIREKFLDPNRGKKGTIKLAESKEIIDTYGREYIKYLKKEIKESKKKVKLFEVLNNCDSKKQSKEEKIDFSILKITLNTRVHIYKEITNIMRQGIGEHERILKSAILKNTKSDK